MPPTMLQQLIYFFRAEIPPHFIYNTIQIAASQLIWCLAISMIISDTHESRTSHKKRKINKKLSRKKNWNSRYDDVAELFTVWLAGCNGPSTEFTNVSEDWVSRDISIRARYESFLYNIYWPFMAFNSKKCVLKISPRRTTRRWIIASSSPTFCLILDLIHTMTPESLSGYRQPVFQSLFPLPIRRYQQSMKERAMLNIYKTSVCLLCFIFLWIKKTVSW